MNDSQTLRVRVACVETVTPAIKRFTLIAADGGELPRFSAGSHVVVHMVGKGRVYRNAYSLMGDPADRRRYCIGVRRQEQSRGGSVFMHEQVGEGDLLEISPPANLFALDRLAAKHLLIAGGIGITPFMSYLGELDTLPARFELHYAFRSKEHAAFADELATRLDERLHLYDAQRNEVVRPESLLADQPLGTHVYVCGPQGLIRAVVEAARGQGWPDSHIHFEQFSAPQPGSAFRVRCARSGRVIEVDSDVSLLDALEGAGISVPSMCRGGVCGQCETALLDGEAEHRDSFLPAAERSRKIMPCVSRARSAGLVLDL
jgi:ferredoxin-NADP reductase